jgi:DNA-binding transcriptional regulator YiaG
MKTTKWKDFEHGIAPERMAEIREEARQEIERVGFAALRKARRMTQVELAKRLAMDQGGVSQLESRSDVLLSTLSRYIRALGGEMRIQAVFPEANFDLEPLQAVLTLGKTPTRKRTAKKQRAA